ncbi:MAG: hypothetical protein PVH24_03765, partial [Candidatus Zixiibacteriota bacterium]
MPTTKVIPPAPTWDLDSIFPGGSASTEFEQFRYKTKCSIDDLRTLMKSLPKHLDDGTVDQWVEFVLKLQESMDNIEMILSFSHCLISQDVSDAK